MNCDPDPPFITDGDMQALAPLLPDLQKLANKESNCAALLPVAEGDNIMDAFLEALLALFSNAKQIKVEMQATLRGFPRLLRLASHLDLPVGLTLNLPRPSWQLEEFLGWRFGRENGTSNFTLHLEKSALCLYRHIIQSATAHDLAFLRITAGKQTLPLDVEDIVSAFRTHKTIRTLILDWTPWQSGDPSEPHPKTASFPLRSYFSLKGLQNLQHFTVSSRVLKAALMEPSSGSFAHMLPKSLKMLFISGDCEDWQIAALHDLVRGKHLPNLSRVGVGKIVGWGDLLLECHREMRAAEIEFLINP
ncbi:hypothetical protein J3459_015972 [Metarhizium acridum]|uniref:Uncharacterized protein n=1 Tax=Metarhizium acridum (strain CQMa 102) TaxID=655827 RepID=E9E6D0_METAQ|nr:uncharacterized protein MAC_05428 [Metarhizium acridum CQMa 102]EFY88534.1 hypothetical protein MAC_05428 [Metarhizium acridum CQMa 102]KAG8407534.1 hypothetical protein J3458_020286 [Metarhizium acridum]KAG8407975.1 hypothetical protein J3458_020280 [Metarhizium acridum]KAG8412090.1 hypothetical protein J3459_015972 [Metarhizium acridum]